MSEKTEDTLYGIDGVYARLRRAEANKEQIVAARLKLRENGRQAKLDKQRKVRT